MSVIRISQRHLIIQTALCLPAFMLGHGLSVWVGVADKFDGASVFDCWWGALTFACLLRFCYREQAEARR